MCFDLPLLEELVLMQQQLKSVSRPRGNLSKRTVIIYEKHVVGCLELVVSHSSVALSSLKLLMPWMYVKYSQVSEQGHDCWGRHDDCQRKSNQLVLLGAI